MFHTDTIYTFIIWGIKCMSKCLTRNTIILYNLNVCQSTIVLYITSAFWVKRFLNCISIITGFNNKMIVVKNAMQLYYILRVE